MHILVRNLKEQAHKMVHKEGYEVPRVTMRMRSMETVDSDEDFEQPPP